MKLLRTCREVTHLVLASQDRPLSAWERTTLRLHWMICAPCTRFRDQARTLRTAMDRWRAYRDAE